jgi:hypothetical protein
LGVSAATGIGLDTAVNVVGNFAATDATSGDVKLRDKVTALTVGDKVTADTPCFAADVTGVTGPANITLCNTGDLTVDQAVTAGTTGTVRLTSTNGKVTQLATGVITAASLGVSATTGIGLDTAINLVGNFAANDATTGDVKLRDNVTTLTVGDKVVADTPCFTADVTGVTGPANITLCNTGDLTIDQAVTAGTTATVRLTSTNGKVTQLGTGVITAASLGVSAATGIGLDTAINVVGNFAATDATSGDVKLRDKVTTLTVGDKVTADTPCFTADVTGVTGPANITLCNTGDLTVDQAVTAGTTATVRLTSTNGKVSQLATGVITAASLGVTAKTGIGLDTAVNVVGNFTASDATTGDIKLQDKVPTLTLGDKVTADTPCFPADLTGVVGPANITICNSGTPPASTVSLTADQAVTAGATSTVRLTSTNGQVTQLATGVITAASLGVSAATGILLDTAVNVVGNFAATDSTSGDIKLQNNVPTLTLGDKVTADTPCFPVDVIGVTSPGNITVCNTGNLTLDQAITAGATGTVRLTATNGQITQAAAGRIQAAAVGIQAGGAVTLTNANNSVTTIAANLTAAGAALQFTSSTHVVVDAVGSDSCFTGATGITTNTGNVTLTTGTPGPATPLSTPCGPVTTHGDTLTVNRNITVGTAQITINANPTDSGDVTVNNTAVITAKQTTINMGSGAGDLIIHNPTASMANPAGLFAPSGAFTLNGSNQAGDFLVLLDGGAAALNETYSVGPASNAGTIQFGGPATPSLAFSGILNPLIDSITTGSYTVSATTVPNSISLQNSPIVGSTCLRVTIEPLSGPVHFQPVEFANKTNVTINGVGSNTLNGGDNVLLDYTHPSPGLQTVTFHGNLGNDTISVRNTPANILTSIFADHGTNQITAGSQAPNLGGVVSGIQGELRVDGGTGTSTLTVDNSGDMNFRSAVLNSTRLTGLGMGPAGIGYTNLATLNIHLGHGNDTFTIANTHTGVTNVDSQSGAKNFGIISTSGQTNLTGGSGNSSFNFGDGATLSGGRVNGGGGAHNLLNFTAYTTPVFVNLSTSVITQAGQVLSPQSAQRPSGPPIINLITNIQDVVGGKSNDILVGSNTGHNILNGLGGNNTIIGLGGNDILLAGSGSNNITGAGNDVLFAGPIDPASHDNLTELGGTNNLVLINSCVDVLQRRVTINLGPLAPGGTSRIDLLSNHPDIVSIIQFDQSLRGPSLLAADELSVSVPAYHAVLEQMAMAFLTSSEYRANLIRGYYEQFLGRAADDPGLQAWLNMMASGARDEDIMVDFLTSPEYYAKNGGTDAGFILGLYQDVLGRGVLGNNVSQAEVDYWVGVLHGVGRAAVARDFVSSDEYRSGLLNAWYQQYFGRSADSGGLSFWLQQMRQGLTLEQVQTALLVSPEYHQRVLTEYAAYTSGAFIRGLYDDVLGRTPSDGEVNFWMGMFAFL